MTEVSDIIDEIDQLVDEQMAGGEPIGGYDYNDPDFPKCPHCDRDFHGIALTQRILDMRNLTGWDENYRVDTDYSPMVCEGSLFIGPVRPQRIQVRTVGDHPFVIFSEQAYEYSAVPGLSASTVTMMVRDAHMPQEYRFERPRRIIQGVIDTLTALGVIDPFFAMENLLPEAPNLPVLRPSHLPALVEPSEGWMHAGSSE